MKVWDGVLVILTGLFLPSLGFVAGALVAKRHWTAVLRDRWHKGYRTGLIHAHKELDALLWKGSKEMRAGLRTRTVDYGAEFVQGWEAAALYTERRLAEVEDEDE